MSALRNYIERIEALEEDKKAIGEDLAEVYQEAKSDGYDNVVMKAVVKRRKMSDGDRLAADELLATYEANLVQQMDLPLDERSAPLKREQVRAGTSEDRLRGKVRDAIMNSGFEADPDHPNVFHSKTPETVN